MALRFLAIISTSFTKASVQTEELRARLDLSRVINARHLQVFADTTPSALHLGKDNGVVLGHLFRKSGNGGLVTHLNEHEVSEINASTGGELMTGFWGGYVAFLRTNGTTPQIRVIRDPSGALPCYFADTSYGLACASDIETLFDSGFYSPTINWQAVRQHLLAYDLRKSTTCLGGVSELLAGERLVVSADGVATERTWSPWDHISTKSAASPQAQAEQLKEVTSQCLLSWSDAFPRTLLGISGGLDSSIIAATLGRVGKSVTCLTMATDHAEGDERLYARVAAQAAGLPLVERFHDVSDIDILVSTSRHLPRPVLPALAQSEYRTKSELTRELGAEAYLTGIGGDNVFCHMRSATPLLDRVLSSGFTAEAWETLNDICDLTACSYWDACLMALRRAARLDWKYAWTLDARFLNKSEPISTISHPWLDAPKNCLPGKAAHIAMLLRIQGTIDGFPRRGMVPMMNPLLSQPIVEFCLTIPSWAWVQGGEDRAVARQAFTDRLPPELLHRRSKGGPGTFAAQIIERSRWQILDQLDGGMLDRQGLIDVPAVRTVLDGNAPIAHQHLPRLLLLAETEAWCRHWSVAKPIGG